jgi:hypothetical protein
VVLPVKFLPTTLALPIAGDNAASIDFEVSGFEARDGNDR